MKFKTILERSSLRICVIALFVWMVAYAIRLQYLSFVEINSDSLSSYLSALKFWTVGFPPPPNPESDHWMWLSKVPWLWCASSLEDLFHIRFFIGASMAPMAAWCVWYSSRRYRHISALACGMFVALDKGLIDTLISSFRGYMAPEWVSLATVFFVLSRTHKWALPLVGACVVIAGGHHPMALGVLLAVGWLCFDQSKYAWWIILGIAIFGVFRCLSLYEIMQCDAGGWACVQTIALGSSEQLSLHRLLFRIVHDRFWVEMGWSCGFLFGGLLLSSNNDVWKWCFFSCLGILVLGMMINTLRPYHLRALLIPMLVPAIGGFQRLRAWIYPIFVLWGCGLWYSSADIVGVQNAIQYHDKAGKEIQKYSDIWMESSESSPIFIPGVGLSAVLSGFSLELFSNYPKRTVLIFSEETKPKEFDVIELDDDILWGGGHDWATSIYPSEFVHGTLP